VQVGSPPSAATLQNAPHSPNQSCCASLCKPMDIRNRKSRLMPNATTQRTSSVPGRLVSHHFWPNYLFMTLTNERIIL